MVKYVLVNYFVISLLLCMVSLVLHWGEEGRGGGGASVSLLTGYQQITGVCCVCVCVCVCVSAHVCMRECSVMNYDFDD